MYQIISEKIFPLFMGQPERYAYVTGSKEYPDLHGMIMLYRFGKGTVVVADIAGLPENGSGVYGFHIHEGTSCTGTETDPFADAKGHYTVYGYEHPQHLGDMPVLFGNQGIAWGAFYTEKFYPGEVAGRTVIIHGMPDDYHTQPSGNSGEKIACGVIY
ncbi:MAG TPA: superoxide dismutase family protein [Lachnospiraceae bacterium]|nr:superoxide dismutase family protein [Lachnospiraceae bacterium]